MGLIVPGDVFLTGMGHHADFAAQFLLAVDHRTDSRKGGRGVGADVALPALIFFHQLLLGEAVPFPAHFRKAQMEAAGGVFFQGDGGSRAEFVENILKKGEIYILFTLHHGVVVVQYQAGVAKHPIISDSRLYWIDYISTGRIWQRKDT